MHRNLQALLKKYGLNYQYLANYLGRTVQNVCNKINGKSKFDIEEIQQIISLFNDLSTNKEYTFEDIFFSEVAPKKSTL